jgi:hypothetical protein
MGGDQVYERTDAVNGYAQVLGPHLEDELIVYQSCTVVAMSETSHVPHPPLSSAKRHISGRPCSASLAWPTPPETLGKLNDKENIQLSHHTRYAFVVLSW